jgi:hypothetical protein
VSSGSSEGPVRASLFRRASDPRKSPRRQERGVPSTQIHVHARGHMRTGTTIPRNSPTHSFSTTTRSTATVEPT